MFTDYTHFQSRINDDNSTHRAIGMSHSSFLNKKSCLKSFSHPSVQKSINVAPKQYHKLIKTAKVPQNKLQIQKFLFSSTFSQEHFYK